MFAHNAPKFETGEQKPNRHIRTCKFEIQHMYVGGIYHSLLTLFELLDEVGIHLPAEDRYFLFRATSDFEAYFSK